MNLEHEQVVQHQSRTGEDRYIGGRSNRYCVTEIASLYYTFLFLRFFFSFFPFYSTSSSRFIRGLCPFFLFWSLIRLERTMRFERCELRAINPLKHRLPQRAPLSFDAVVLRRRVVEWMLPHGYSQWIVYRKGSCILRYGCRYVAGCSVTLRCSINVIYSSWNVFDLRHSRSVYARTSRVSELKSNDTNSHVWRLRF